MKRRWKEVFSRWRWFLLVAMVVVLAAAWAGTGSEPSAADLLKGSLFLEHVQYLASNDLEGRGNGSEGLERAAQYVASRFREIGLQPAGSDGSYFQPFSVTLGGKLGPNNRLVIEGPGAVGDLRVHEDFEPLTFTGAGTAHAPIAFVGYGITAPEKDYDDYQGVDAGGKVVAFFRHLPREGKPDAPFAPESDHATFVSKTVNAKAHGAIALLVFNDPLNHAEDELLKFGEDLGAEDLDIPAVQIRRERVEALFEAVGKDLVALQRGIDETLKPASFELGARARLDIDVARSRSEVRNILGYIPPSGVHGDEELLIIGGHYDHVGRGHQYSRASKETRGQIHNGADDNASGTAGILELARVFATRTDLRRGILFAAFAGEELGLLGSSHYTQHPTRPLEKTVAMINLDMIGRLRNGKLYIGGVGTSPVFGPLFDEVGKEERIEFSYGFSGYGSSDHTSFTLKGIPSLFFFTGLHDDYHRPTDDWEEISPEGAEHVLRVAYKIADTIQALPERPAFVRSSQDEKRPSGGGGYGAYFGSVPDFGHEDKGVRFAGIREESPAALAGLQEGDVLIEFEGRAIDNLYDFTDALRRHKPGDEVTVKVLRNQSVVEAKVKLGRRP